MAPPAFPTEIHSMIIRFATYCPVYFDISPDPRFWPVDHELYTVYNDISTDYMTKKALTLVSHQFRYASLPYLYEVVQVHESSSMHRLADVLETTWSGVTTNDQEDPRKIQHLFVSVMRAKDEQGKYSVFKSLGRILTHCGSLRGFGLYDAVPFRVDKPHSWLMSIPKGVRFIDWKGTVMASDFPRVIGHVSESLIALRLSNLTVLDNNTSPHSASLPKLTHFAMPEEHAGIGVLNDWSMPSLTHLRVNVSSSSMLERVIGRVGNSLRNAILGPRVAPELLLYIATVARNLEDCIYHFHVGMEQSWAMIRSHPSLKSIVVVFREFSAHASHNQWILSILCNHLQPLPEGHFPSLCRIGFVGIDPYSTFDARNRAHLDELLNAWHASGIEVKYLGQ
ncbi:hypothetical protein BD410DRAFT_900387 [Rickenella mellea]|uniref:F-box domain-containing protein n=1 Tax=Rickenella mellea TaxID=50990 RepID=A0A4Y7PVM7_9AGAM|nr:hypothetical protein BD410DRAFT_900387 [Rickenella mellea]